MPFLDGGGEVSLTPIGQQHGHCLCTDLIGLLGQLGPQMGGEANSGHNRPLSIKSLRTRQPGSRSWEVTPRDNLTRGFNLTDHGQDPSEPKYCDRGWPGTASPGYRGASWGLSGHRFSTFTPCHPGEAALAPPGTSRFVGAITRQLGPQPRHVSPPPGPQRKIFAGSTEGRFPNRCGLRPSLRRQKKHHGHSQDKNGRGQRNPGETGAHAHEASMPAPSESASGKMLNF